MYACMLHVCMRVSIVQHLTLTLALALALALALTMEYGTVCLNKHPFGLVVAIWHLAFGIYWDTNLCLCTVRPSFVEAATARHPNTRSHIWFRWTMSASVCAENRAEAAKLVPVEELGSTLQYHQQEHE